MEINAMSDHHMMMMMMMTSFLLLYVKLNEAYLKRKKERIKLINYYSKAKRILFDYSQQKIFTTKNNRIYIYIHNRDQTNS